MINIENLSFAYSRRRPPVVSDLNLFLEPGQVYGLLGPNGAGKSTLLQLIAGALTPSAGEVLINGVNSRRRLPLTLSSFFLVPEEYELPKLSLEKFVESTAPFYPRFDRDVLDHCLEVFGLSPDQKLSALSMGQRKKIILSFGFACRTDILLLDEPTNGLDIPGKIAFRRLVAELTDESRMIIISTHQVRDLDQILDHLLIMDPTSLIVSASIPRIQSRLRFIHNADRSMLDQALASIPSPGGFDVMVRNDDEQEESQVNLELLFDYALSNPQQIREILRY